MTAPTRTCAAANRCRDYDPVKKRAADLTPTDAPLCQTCTTVAEREIRALVLDYRDLEQLLPPSQGVRGDGRAGFGHPVPLRLHIDTLQRDIWWVLTAWETIIRETARLSDLPDGRTRNGWDVQRAVTVLAPRVDMLARIESAEMWSYPIEEHAEAVTVNGELSTVATLAGWQGVLDMSRLRSRARVALGLTSPQPEVLYGIPCKSIECEVRGALYRLPGDDDVHCGACGRWYSAEEYTKWVKLVASSAHALRHADNAA